jgi:hypothetical protein
MRFRPPHALHEFVGQAVLIAVSSVLMGQSIRAAAIVTHAAILVPPLPNKLGQADRRVSVLM